MEIIHCNSTGFNLGFETGKKFPESDGTYEATIPHNADGYSVISKILPTHVVLEVTLYDSIVQGFKISFTGNKTRIKLSKDGNTIVLSREVSINHLVGFFNANNIPWSVYKLESFGHRISLQAFKAIIFFFVFEREFSGLVSVDENINFPVQQ